MAALFLGSLLGLLLTGKVIFIKLLAIFFILACFGPALDIGMDALKDKYPKMFKS